MALARKAGRPVREPGGRGLHGRVSETGRLSVPVELRRQVGLEKGGVVRIEVVDGAIRIRTMTAVKDHVRGTGARDRARRQGERRRFSRIACGRANLRGGCGKRPQVVALTVLDTLVIIAAVVGEPGGDAVFDMIDEDAGRRENLPVTRMVQRYAGHRTSESLWHAGRLLRRSCRPRVDLGKLDTSHSFNRGD